MYMISLTYTRTSKLLAIIVARVSYRLPQPYMGEHLKKWLEIPGEISQNSSPDYFVLEGGQLNEQISLGSKDDLFPVHLREKSNSLSMG